MPIKNIIIENIRGIRQIKIDSEISKNCPNILVAPNGFGKTSIATAFKCAANQTFIKVSSEDRHQHEEDKKAKIELELEENGSQSKYSVTEVAHSNNIRKVFDIHVVSDIRRIKAHSQKIGNYSRAKAKTVIDPIVICAKSEREDNPYQISKIKRIFGSHKNALPNITTALFQSGDFLMRSPECWPYINVLVKPRKWKAIEKVRKQFSEYNGNTDDALVNAATAIDDLFDKLQEAKDFHSIIKETTILGEHGKVDVFLAIWQMLLITKKNGDSLENYLKWLRYSKIKKSLWDGLKNSSASWKMPSLKETQGELVVEMPAPNDISNGQRDVLLLISLLHIARYHLTKSKAILIVDEVFDYLDDANLIVAQYYISQLITDYKRQSRSIYIMILTHLNPTFFRNYVFSKQKIIYLSNDPVYKSTKEMRKLISTRSLDECNKELKENISKYLVHYHIDKYDFSKGLDAISGTNPDWGIDGNFQEFLKEEFRKYSNGKSYDPLAICAITRRAIEELAFRQIHNRNAESEFFITHKTGRKLDWAVQRGAIVPDTHYLLRVIFDDGLHWDLNRDNTIPIVAKLAHPIIKKMIMEVVYNSQQTFTRD